jgi:hypothetical protein
MNECIDSVVKAGKGAVSKKDAIEMLAAYEEHLDAQRAAGNSKAMDLSPDEQFARKMMKDASQKKWNWLNDKVTINKRLNEMDFTDEASMKTSFDKINVRMENAAETHKDILDADFTRSLKPEDRIAYMTRQYDEVETTKLIGKMMVPDAEAHLIPKIGDVRPELHQAYRIAEAKANLLKQIHKEKTSLGVPVGFLKGYIGRNSYDQVKYLDEAGIAKFKSEALEKFNWDDFSTGKLSREEFLDQMVNKIRNGLFDSQVDEIKFYDELGQMQTAKDFARGSLTRRLGKQRTVQMTPENALAMHKEYGAGDLNSIFQREIDDWSRSKALLQFLGSNPEKQYDKMMDSIVRATPQYGGEGTHFIKDRGSNYRDFLLGKLSDPAGHLKKRVFATLRTAESVSHLGFGLVTSLADIVTPGVRKALVQMDNSIGGNIRIHMENLAEQFAMITGEYGDEVGKKIVKGMMEEMEDSLFDFKQATRFGGDIIGRDGSGRAVGGGYSLLNLIDDGNKTIQKFNFIDWWTKGAIKRQYAPIAREFGEFADRGFDEVPAFMQRQLRTHGLVDDWDMIRSTKIASEDGRLYIDPRAFDEISDADIAKYYPGLKSQRSIANKKDELRTSLRNAFAVEAKQRVIMPNVTTSSRVAMGLKRGQIGAEVVDSAFQFKSYPIALWKTLIAPAFTQGAPTIATFTAFSMGTNMMIMWMHDYLNNRTPRPFTTQGGDVEMDVVARNWLSLGGRSIGYPVAEEIFTKVAMGEFQMGDLASMAGPTMSDSMKTLRNLSDISSGLAKDKPGKAAKGASELLMGLPVISGALHGTLLTKPLTNLWKNNLYETFTPGYLTGQERYKEKQGSSSLVKQ